MESGGSFTSDDDDPGIDVEDDAEGLDNIGSMTKGCGSEKLAMPTPRMDSYRFSMANLEDSQDVELDAILGELCALETQFDREVSHKGPNQILGMVSHSSSGKGPRLSLGPPLPNQSLSGIVNGHQGSTPGQRYISHNRSSSGGTRPKFEIGGLHMDLDGDDHIRSQKEFGLRTDSPDNDSAFSDNVSMLSSESSASSGGVARTDTSSQSMSSQSSRMSLASSPTQAEQAAHIKAEKIKIALEKIREASIKKLFIKAFTADNSAKSLLIDERMTVGHVCHLLAEKNHVVMDTKWAIVEHIPELYMERIFEDHENLVENVLLWTRDSTNKLLFLQKEEKYDLFLNPEDYLLSCSSSEKGAELDDEGKITLLEEFFSSTGVGVPEVEGHLYLKSDGKKAWKKHFFVLRASGLYYCPKGKSKFSKDLSCLTTFEMNNVYVGFGWRKKFKAPTDFGFAIKHPQIQTKSSKYIKYLCTEDERSLYHWVIGIRVAKYGRQIKENYETLVREIVEDDLDTLAHARSFSICSMAKTMTVSPDSSGSPATPDRPDLTSVNGISHQYTQEVIDSENQCNRSSESTPTSTTPTPFEKPRRHGSIARQDSIKSSTSSSSGCMSERSSTGTPTAEQIAFEADFPIGTIKRKPSMTPKIPLTNTTRSIAKQSGEESLNVVSLDNVSLSSSSSSGSSNVGSLGRAAASRLSLRRSHTDDRITFNCITKKLSKKPSSDSLSVNSRVKENEVDDLPLPPPPPELQETLEIDSSSLPLPPPEAFKSSTLSLDSLPPPPPIPPPLDDESSWPSTSSLNSLPPPPSPILDKSEKEERKMWNGPLTEQEVSTILVVTPEVKAAPAVPPKPHSQAIQRRLSEADAIHHNQSLFLNELKQGTYNAHKSQHRPKLNIDCYSSSHEFEDNEFPSDNISPIQNKASPTGSVQSKFQNYFQGRTGGINLQSPSSLDAQSPTSQSSGASGGRKSRIQQKPSPPKRSETTKLTTTTPVRRSSSASSHSQEQTSSTCPPASFLRDLHRVMEKKWKVAQQLSVDHSATPHQILGFRDPCYLPPASADQLQSPTSPPSHHPSHYERPSRSLSQPRHPRKKSPHDETCNSGAAIKRPPPPPPKRSETTHLSRW
ncbi:abnormal cell migration protein 10 isoform X3 [Centruroides vittatus]|uniref:abnormal cell migration protein 10 isoform X3 n=1 Tax=Centruroides vittatus TaxID=120091 RepID=UPI00350FFD98